MGKREHMSKDVSSECTKECRNHRCWIGFLARYGCAEAMNPNYLPCLQRMTKHRLGLG